MLWIKALHIIFMVTWFAGLFYLPRLFVYHAQAQDEVGRARFVVMERRLFFLMSLGAIATLVLGLTLLVRWWWPAPRWLHIKLGLVALLTLYHLYCHRLMLDLRLGRRLKSPRFYRGFNEIPTLLLIAIVLLAVLKPG
jgi:putative membrane protein